MEGYVEYPIRVLARSPFALATNPKSVEVPKVWCPQYLSVSVGDHRVQPWGFLVSSLGAAEVHCWSEDVNLHGYNCPLSNTWHVIRVNFWSTWRSGCEYPYHRLVCKSVQDWPSEKRTKLDCVFKFINLCILGHRLIHYCKPLVHGCY